MSKKKKKNPIQIVTMKDGSTKTVNHKPKKQVMYSRKTNKRMSGKKYL